MSFFLAIVFFFTYSYSESNSRISKFVHETNFIKQKYNILLTQIFHIVYCCTSFGIFLTKTKSPSFLQNQKRFTFYFILTNISMFVTIATQIVFVLFRINEKSIVPLYSYITTHLLIAYTIVFIHHPISKQELIESNFQANSFQYK